MDKSADNAGQYKPDAYAKQGLALSVAHTGALQAFVKQRQLTLNTLVQGAWGLLLSRYSGENDVVFGVTVSGRPAELSGVESMVGLFINSLPVRVKVPGESAAIDWLQALFGQNQDMQRFEYAPLTQIQGWSEVPRGVPLFESLLVFENYPIDQALTESLDGLTIDVVNVVDQSNYPLVVSAFPGTELRLEINYATDRFETETIKRMLGHLQGLLEAFTLQSQMRLSELPYLSEAEKQQILGDWNAGEAGYPKDQTIHQRFETQAEKTPDAVAAVFEGQTLSYAELNAKANQLARYLRSRMAGPEVLVGICLERSLDMVIGLLGILKAGGAYVPLDPAYPRERITLMLNGIAAPIVITQESLQSLFGEISAPCLCIDSDWPLIGREPSSNLNIAVHPQQLAYVIYTSGSTGNPKGVMISHHDVLRLFHTTEQKFNFSEQDVWTMFHSYAFDFSVWEIWGALLYGGRLVVVPFWISRSPAEFYDLLVKEQVTVLNQTPSAFQQLVQAEDRLGGLGNLALRFVIFGGESLDTLSLKPWFDKHGDRTPRLINMYGITETTVHVTFRELGRQDSLEAGGSPIGCPIDDLQLYLLDAGHNLCPINVNGEINVGGAGLARGYLNRPDLTAERFIPNPYGEPGSRMYRSGDLARYQQDSNINYQGRIDHQVKIRGFRIELGEIEARLFEAPDIKEAVVIAREDQPGDKRLVAYLVADKAAVDIELLKLRLKQTLPEYMIPSAFVMLEHMPLTANGKLDRKRLPRPDISEMSVQRYVAPRTAGEEILAEIWADVLGVEKVGVEDNFFELGGHSLTATVLLSRVTKQFQVDIPLHAVFSTPTVSGLSLIIEELLIEKLEALSEYEVEDLFNQNNSLVD